MAGTPRLLWPALIIASMVLGGGLIYAGWEASKPSNERFARVLQRLLKEEHGDKQERCIRVPGTFDSSRRAGNALAWRMDEPDSAPNARQEKQHAKRRVQLDALVDAGLLLKSRVVTRKNEIETPATRYRLSDLGWAVTIASSNPYCFPYGEATFRGVTKFERTALYETAGIEVYVVSGVMALDDTKLPRWASNPQIRTAFPEIDEDIAGREFKVPLVRGGGDWVAYASMGREERLRAEQEKIRSQTTPELKQEIEKMKAKEKVLIAALEKLKAPDIAEISRILRKRYGDGVEGEWPNGCIALPGSERMPVDVELHLPGALRDIPLDTLRTMYPGRTLPGPSYGFGIHVDKPRDARHPISARTIPYAERLVAIGFLVKRHDPALMGKDKLAHASDIYEVSPAMAANIPAKHPDCLSLGAPKVEIVALHMDSDPEFPSEQIKFCLRLRYLQPPQWMRDPDLQSKWPELREQVAGGMACEGEFGFDRETRDLAGGTGGCFGVAPPGA